MGVSLWKRALNTAQIQNDYSIYPSGLKWRSNTLFILATIAIGLFTDLFLYGLIVPVLPFMLEDRAGVPPDQTQSYVSSMLAVYAGSSFLFSPIAGVLADRVSTRQAPFLLALSIMLGATVLLFLGHTVEVFLVARVLQGISSAVVWSVGLALCVETVGSDNLGKTIGTVRLNDVLLQFHADTAVAVLIYIGRQYLGSFFGRPALRKARLQRCHWRQFCGDCRRLLHAGTDD